MISNFHKVAEILKPVAEQLVFYLNDSIVKQAMEKKLLELIDKALLIKSIKVSSLRNNP